MFSVAAILLFRYPLSKSLVSKQQHLPVLQANLGMEISKSSSTPSNSTSAAVNQFLSRNSGINMPLIETNKFLQLPGDRFNLQRFVNAQSVELYEDVIDEITLGRKRSHWMWFIFPQKKGVYPSQMSRYYGITSQQEAYAFLKHPVLGPRLVECTRLVLAAEDRSLHNIFSSPDDDKFLRCMELFCSFPSEYQSIFSRGMSLK